MRRTFQEQLLQGSTLLNGVLIPMRSIGDVLARYVTNLVVLQDDPVYRVSIPGSATLLLYRGRFVMVCCMHQLKGSNLENVGLLKTDGSLLITSAGVRHFTHRTESDFSDLAVFDFTDPCEAHPELQERFFRFHEVPPDGLNTDTIFAQVTGFPSNDQKYELEEQNHLGSVRRRILCELAPPPADDALFRLRPVEPLSFKPDGLSGGSVFVVQMADGRPAGYFAGIVVRAGRNHIYALKSGYIRSVIDQILNEDRDLTSGSDLTPP